MVKKYRRLCYCHRILIFIRSARRLAIISTTCIRMRRISGTTSTSLKCFCTIKTSVKPNIHNIYRTTFVLLKLNYFSQEIDRETLIMAANSVSLPATRVLTEALRHLRYLILEELTERCSEALSPDSISWILTVPAIWNKKTRQLIKEIAIEVKKDMIFSYSLLAINTCFHL